MVQRRLDRGLSKEAGGRWREASCVHRAQQHCKWMRTWCATTHLQTPFESPVKGMHLEEHLPDQQVISNLTFRVCFLMMQSSCTHSKNFCFHPPLFWCWWINWFCSCCCNRNHHSTSKYSFLGAFVSVSFSKFIKSKTNQLYYKLVSSSETNPCVRIFDLHKSTKTSINKS